MKDITTVPLLHLFKERCRLLIFRPVLIIVVGKTSWPFTGFSSLLKSSKWVLLKWCGLFFWLRHRKKQDLCRVPRKDTFIGTTYRSWMSKLPTFTNRTKLFPPPCRLYLLNIIVWTLSVSFWLYYFRGV